MKDFLKKSFTNLNDLLDFLEIFDRDSILNKSSFPLLIPFRLAQKIKKNDLKDPIFRQFVPQIEENHEKPFFSEDPLCEAKYQKGKLIKKYKNRALLLCSNSCAMNCRFCFRRHLNKNYKESFQDELNQISKDPFIEEIILSGGDPLSLSNQKIEELLLSLDNISHIKTIRIHTRFIFGYPERIDDQFIQILKNIKKQKVFVFHINYINEIDEDIIKAIEKLKKLNIILFSQTVLLKDINDAPSTLIDLYKGLISIGVIPYYLHQLDRTQGASHYEVTIPQGLKLVKELRKELSGYLVPKYVQEIPNKKNKTPL